jgi:hypothetical protein
MEEFVKEYSCNGGSYPDTVREDVPEGFSGCAPLHFKSLFNGEGVAGSQVEYVVDHRP